MRISDWSSDVCSSDLFDRPLARAALSAAQLRNPLPQDVDPAGVAADSEMLAERLRRLRQERGLSRVELSNRTGFSKPSIWAWESGRTLPRRSNLIALADAFGISERQMFARQPALAERSATAKLHPT